MFRKLVPMILGALLVLPVGAAAEEACFENVDFDGICLTQVPREGLFLGERALRPGDVLTAQQAAQVTFSGESAAQLGYLPILGEQVGAETSLTLRGKENKAPAAEDAALETYKNIPVSGKLKASDPEGETMSFSVMRQGKRGTVTLGEAGEFTYTPKKNKVGVDSFTYTATDPAGKVSREATVTITILRPNDGSRYSDTVGKDCCFAAEWMKNTGIFTGEDLAGNACFCPEKAVTRGEFITMMVRAMDLPVEKELTATGYEDVPEWLRPYLAAAVRSGLTAMLPARESFGAEEEQTCQEAAALLCGALDLEEPMSAVEDALGVSLGIEEDGVLNRGQAAMMMYYLGSR